VNNPRAIIAAVAREYLGTRETSKNRGPHLEEFWKATSYPDGADNREPWCSAFATFCVREADRRSPDLALRIPPTFAAVSQWLPWAHDARTGCLVFTPLDIQLRKYTAQAGDLVSFLPHLSHIGIVVSDYAGGAVIQTIEGNTNGDGSREGDGVYRKTRSLSFCGSFIRIPAVGEKLV
jgi:hypothetical protein